MKLIFTQDTLGNGGAERSHLEILSRFSKEVDVGFVYFYPKHDLKPEYERAGIRLFFLEIPETYHFHLAIYRLVRLIKKEKPDLLVSSLWRADIITRIASWVTGVPLVGTFVNDSYAPIAWTDKKGLKYKVVYWLDRLTAGIPIHWIANAQALADSHIRTLGITQKKISVVYRGRAVPVLPQPQSVPAPHVGGSPQTGISIKNFISYGRLLERKGFQDAIQAFDQVLKKYPDCTLTIFGEGPFRKNLEALIQEKGLHNSVFLPGKISNPMDLLISGLSKYPKSEIRNLTSFHCFLFPSWYEGFSGALVEAMMAGMPIIASDIPMNLEAVTDQKSALVFPVQSIESLKDRMNRAIENPSQMEVLGREARNVAIERFNIDLIACQYFQVLSEILNHRELMNRF